MFKKILIGILATVVVIAAATSFYNTVSASGPTLNQSASAAQGNGNGNGRNGNGQGSQFRGKGGNGSGTPNPQNGLTEWVTFSGVVSDYVAPKFSLLTADGQTIPAELGNTNYVTNLGLALKDGDAVTVTGFWDTNGGLALKSLTLDSTGQTFTFRDDLGRPLWAGGQGHTAP